MGLIDSIKRYFSREQQEVYCQSCGNELTERGGDVTSSRKIYCHGDNGIHSACGVSAAFSGQETEMLSMNFYEPAEVQRAIMKNELTQFGPLEQTVEDTSRATPTN